MIGAVTFVFARPIILLFDCPASAVKYAVAYLKIYACGTVFVMLSQGLNPFILTQGHSLIAMSSVLLGAIINILLDPVWRPCSHSSAPASVFYAFSFQGRVCSALREGRCGLSPQESWTLYRWALPPFVMTLMECAIQIVFNINLKRATGGDENYTAALTVMLSALQLISLPLNGLGNGMRPFASYNYGRGNADRLKKGIISMSRRGRQSPP